jgi:hypothetical protein
MLTPQAAILWAGAGLRGDREICEGNEKDGGEGEGVRRLCEQRKYRNKPGGAVDVT